MRTDRGFDRFVTFLDAVVAIAITQLVLPLVFLSGPVDRLLAGRGHRNGTKPIDPATGQG